MSSDELVIEVDQVSKCYQIYDNPGDRLKQFLIPRFRALIGASPRSYCRNFWALRDISFQIKKGESVGIIGRNGSGKSSLLQIIAGTLSPSSGSVRTKGRIAALLELGSGFNPNFTGRENVYLNGSLLGFTENQINEKFDSIAAFADIGEYLDQAVKTYSSGMVLRLAFAVQVQIEPEILIIDEALAVGDALFQKRCFQRIQKLLSEGTTILFVSHEQETVRTLTNRALLLDKGIPAFWGGSAEAILEYRKLLHREESLFFKDLIQSTSFDSKKESNLEKTDSISQPSNPESVIEGGACRGNEEEITAISSKGLTYGNREVSIISVKAFDVRGEACSMFYPGDSIRFKILCRSMVCITHLNVGIRIRNKEGVKVYSWGTLNQDMHYLSSKLDEQVFWIREFKNGEFFEVTFDCKCDLGANFYEVQAGVSYEDTPDYLSQRMLHWVDEATFFQVGMKRYEYFFGGILDLKMKATW